MKKVRLTVDPGFFGFTVDMDEEMLAEMVND